MQIQERIEELITSSDPDSANLRGVARSLKALPIYANISGWLALRPDGSIVFLNDSTGKISEEASPMFKTVALVNGSEKYPELKVLLPTKPEDANNGEDCKGIGRGIFEGQIQNHIFCS